jgi:SET domain-containing protein
MGGPFTESVANTPLFGHQPPPFWQVHTLLHACNDNKTPILYFACILRSANVGRFYARNQNRVSFFALRDIPSGEEITINYGRDFWYGREEMELP